LTAVINQLWMPQEQLMSIWLETVSMASCRKSIPLPKEVLMLNFEFHLVQCQTIGDTLYGSDVWDFGKWQHISLHTSVYMLTSIDLHRWHLLPTRLLRENRLFWIGS
jgi:hypothetical protein